MFHLESLSQINFEPRQVSFVDDASNVADIISVILALGTIDESKLSPEPNEGLMYTWIFNASNALHMYRKVCNKMDAKSIIAFIYFGRMAALLEKRTQSLRISTLSVITSDSMRLMDRFPDIFSFTDFVNVPDLTNEFKLVNYLVNLFNLSHFNYKDIVLWAAELAIAEKQIQEQINLDKLLKLPNAISLKNGKFLVPSNSLKFAIIRFLYNRIFKVNVNIPVNAPEFQGPLFSNQPIPLPNSQDVSFFWDDAVKQFQKTEHLYIYSNDFPQCDFIDLVFNFDKIPIGALILLALRFSTFFQYPDDISIIANAFSNNHFPLQSIFMLLLGACESDECRSYLISIEKEPSDEWKPGLELITKNIVVDRYLNKAKNGNVKAARKLLSFPECFDKLDENYELHRVLKILLSSNISPDFSKFQISLETAAILYKMDELFFTNSTLSQDVFFKIIQLCHSSMIQIIKQKFIKTESDFAWILSGCSNLVSPLFLPESPIDIFTYFPKSKNIEIAFLIAFYLTKFFCNNKEELSIETPEFADFMNCSFTSNAFKKHFSPILENSMKYYRDIALLNVEIAFNEQSSFLDKVIRCSKHDDDSFSLIVDTLVRHNSYDLFLEIVSKDHSILPMFATSPFIKQYFKLIETDPPSDILPTLQQILLLNNPEMDVFVYKTITAFALSKPELAICLLLSISIKKNFVETILTSFDTIPSPIPIPLLAFIKEVTNKLPKVQCDNTHSYSNLMNNSWNEDNAIAGMNENNPGTKSNSKQKTIWDYPDDVGQCSHINSGHNYILQPCFHCHTCGIHDNSGLCLSCALRCHRGHDITYQRNSEFYCKCYETEGTCLFKQEDNESPKESHGPTTSQLRQLLNDSEPSLFFLQSFLNGTSPSNNNGPGRIFGISPSNFHTLLSRGPAGLSEGLPQYLTPSEFDDDITNNNEELNANNTEMLPRSLRFSNGFGAFRISPYSLSNSRGRNQPNTNANNANPNANNDNAAIFINAHDERYRNNPRGPDFFPFQRGGRMPFSLNSAFGFFTNSDNHSSGSNYPKQRSKQINEEQAPLKVSTAINIIEKMMNVVPTPLEPLKNNLTCNINDLKLQNLQISSSPKQFAHFENTGSKCIEALNMMLFLNDAMQISTIAAIAGPNLNYIIICEAFNVKVYNLETLQPLNSTEVPLKPSKIAVSPLDPCIFALSSSTEVYVYSLNENGTVELTHKIELMLEEIGQSLYVVNVEWVPLQPLLLAVTCNSFVKIYDIPVDCISPVLCFNSKDKITSSTLIQYEEQLYIFVAMNSGKLAFNECNFDICDGPIKLSKYVAFQSNLSLQKSSCISYSKDEDILFVSNSKSLLIFHASDFFHKLQETPPANSSSHTQQIMPLGNSIPLETPGVYEFVGVHPFAKSLHFLKDRINSNILMLEITDKEISKFLIEPPTSQSLINNAGCSLIGFFISKENVYSVGIDGYFYKLVPGKFKSEVSLKMNPPNSEKLQSETDEEVDGFLFDVPASFWINSRIEKSMVSIIDHRGKDVSILLTGRRQTYSSSKVSFNITLNDTKNVIVGIKICIERRSYRPSPESVKIFNRIYSPTCGYTRDFCLPLKKEEVGIKRTYKVDIVPNEVSGEVTIDGIDVFVINANSLNLKSSTKDFDWISNSAHINEYVDVSEVKCNGDIDFIIQALGAAKYEPENNKELLKTLFIWMYTNQINPDVCRRIILKSAGDKEELLQEVCTDAIIEVCKNGNGPSNQIRKIMWRDYALLTKEQKSKIGNLIWNYYDSESGPLGFSSAFLFE